MKTTIKTHDENNTKHQNDFPSNPLKKKLQDTPYAYGFFFFDIVFPANYPYSPPKVLFKTGDQRVRFNPNLYVEGKVCLSILGTWSGPGWTSICNLRSVMITIQSLLSNHPITNEPGRGVIWFFSQVGGEDVH